jgi:hypothetical protein
MRFQRFFQIVLLLAAVDSLAFGLWAYFQPHGLFNWLQFTTHEPIESKFLGAGFESADEVLLWRVLGLFFLAHALLLILAAWRPLSLGSLVYVPLIGRALMLGLWLWLLGSDRIERSAAALRWLAAHDLAVLIVVAVFLVWHSFSREPLASAASRSPKARG